MAKRKPSTNLLGVNNKEHELIGANIFKASEKKSKDDTVKMIKIDDLIEDDENFVLFSKKNISALAESIEENGIMEPLRAYAMPDGKYLLQSGHRRRLAAKEIGLETVPVIILPWIDDKMIRRRLLIESNLHNRQYSPLELARIIEGYTDTFSAKKKKDMYESLGKIFNMSESSLRRHLSLLELIPELQEKANSPEKYSIKGLCEAGNMSKDQQIEFNALIDKFMEHNDEISQAALIQFAREVKKETKSAKGRKQKTRYERLISLGTDLSKYVNNCPEEEKQTTLDALTELREKIDELISNL